jgi:hypothetical protein
LIKEFLKNLGNDIHELLCDIDVENYDGLDSDRDTEEEVETALRIFPKVLSRKGGCFDEYPIHYLASSYRCNVKAISFIPIVARVAIELGVLFDGEEERGGLLCYDNENDNVLQNLMNSDFPIQLGNREYHEPIDDKYLQVLIQLRKMNLFKKDDIQMNALVTELCNRYYHFSEKRFRFLVE